MAKDPYKNPPYKVEFCTFDFFTNSILKKLFYYLGFSYLKPKVYRPLRIIIISYYTILVCGLFYDLSIERVGYYSTKSDYIQILLADSAFYYMYLMPLVLIFIVSYLWDFFLLMEKKNSSKKKS